MSFREIPRHIQRCKVGLNESKSFEFFSYSMYKNKYMHFIICNIYIHEYYSSMENSIVKKLSQSNVI